MLKYSENKLISDYEVLDNMPTKAVKLSIASEYGLESAKTKEIQKAIIKAMVAVRHEKSSFNESDIKWFNRLDIPSTYKRALPFFEAGPIEFIEYVKEHVKAKLISRRLFNPDTNSVRNVNMSSADKYLVTRYNNYMKFLTENNPDEIIKNAQVAGENAIIKGILLKDMKEFHEAYIERVILWSNKYYSRLPELIVNAKDIVEKTKKTYYKIDHICCDLHNSGKHQESRVMYNKECVPAKKAWEKATRYYNSLYTIIKKYPTVEEYVYFQVHEAEEKYMADIDSIVERIKEKNFNIYNLKVTDVHNDPKFFEMIITDGDKKMFARSIWAAEFSEKVTAHYRFIITNCK